ncbi:hypothetical protein RUND412_010654 [Rhizina undulata]
MFIPRQVQKHSPKRPAQSTLKPPPPPKNISLAPKEAPEAAANGGIDLIAAEELVLALEILFSTYGLLRGKWTGYLKERMRSLEGLNDWVHLSALVECPFLYEAMRKKEVSQVELMRAMKKVPSEILELSEDNYHVRRRSKLDEKLENVKDLEVYTVYIEPQITKVTTHPGKLARFMTQSSLPRRLFPIQNVEGPEKEYGFITFSSEVSQKEIEGELRDLWPENWIVMSKAEWLRRDTLYQEIRRPHHISRLSQPPQLEYEEKVKMRHEPQGETRVPQSYTPGLIVNLTHLHPSTTKTTIISFISRSVDRYKRKRAATLSSPGKDSNSKDPEISPGSGDKAWCLKVNYVEYEKGSTTAYVRLENPADAPLIVKALKARKRIMKDGEDTRGRKAGKTEHEMRLTGEVLEGQEEKAYWEKVMKAKDGKGKKNNVLEIRTEDTMQMKRARERSHSTITTHGKGKKIKFEEE